MHERRRIEQIEQRALHRAIDADRAHERHGAWRAQRYALDLVQQAELLLRSMVLQQADAVEAIERHKRQLPGSTVSHAALVPTKQNRLDTRD